MLCNKPTNVIHLHLYNVIGTVYDKRNKRFPINVITITFAGIYYICGEVKILKVYIIVYKKNKILYSTMGNGSYSEKTASRAVQHKLRKNEHTGVSTFRGGEGKIRVSQWRSSITSSTWLDQCPHLIQGAPAAGEPRGNPAAAGRGAEGRIHGGERGSGSRHKVGSRHSIGGSAGPIEPQTEQNVGHLKCHKPVCGNCMRRAEVIC